MLTQKRPWNSQPQETVEPSQAALADEFEQLIAPTGPFLYDAIRKVSLTMTSGAPPVARVSSAGVGARYGNSGGSQYLYLTCPNTLAGTIVWYGESHTGNPCIFRADPGAGVLLFSNVGSIYARSNGVDALGAGLAGAFPTNTPICIVITGDASGCRIYASGREVGTIAAVWKWTVSTVPLAMHLNGPASGAGDDATDYLIGLSGRAISADCAASISANPWQLFAHRTQRIWTPAASSGQENTTPILTNPNATNVGFTTVSPSVRVEY